MRAFITLQTVCIICVLSLSSQSLFANVSSAHFFGGDSTCMDTFYLTKRGATFLKFKVYPTCDTVQWRVIQSDEAADADAVADSLWSHGAATDTCCFAVDGLSPSTSYSVQLRGWCPDSAAYSNWSTVIFDSTRCEGPDASSLSVTDVTSSKATLHTDVTADGYEWSLRRTSSWSIRQIETDENFIKWINLPSHMEYEWKVRVRCADGTWSDYSEPQLFTTGEVEVNDCDTLKDSHVSHNSITYHSVNLHCHMHGSKYTWGMRKYGSGNWSTYSTTKGFYNWKNLHPSSKYEYKVKVQCEDGYWTDWSTVDYFTTHDHNPCTTPSGHHMSVTDITYNSAHLHCAQDGHEYHWVARKWGSYTWKDLSTKQASYHWKGLSPGTKYEYKVKIKCHNGSWTGWSHSYHFTTKHHYDHCSTPKSHHMHHKYVEHTTASTYCDVKGVEYHWAIKKHGHSNWTHHTTKNSYHNWTNLHEGTKYCYKVKVKCNSYDWTGWSAEYCFTTKEHYGSHCSTPQSHHLSVKDITYHSATTHCEVGGYDYHWAIRPYGSWNWTHKTSSQGHYEWKDLHYNTKYEYKVKVKCHDGTWTNWSYVHHFTTSDHHGSMCSTPQSHHMSVKDVTYNSASTHCGVHGKEYHWAIKPYGSGNWSHQTSPHGSYHWKNLKHKTKYAYKVKVKCNSYDWTGWSKIYFFTTKDHYSNDCSTPQSHHLSVKNISYNQASTHCSVSGVKYHWALRKKGTYSWKHHTSSHGHYNWSGLHGGSKYEYKVKVQCHNGYWTGWSHTHHFTTHDHYGTTCSTPHSSHMSYSNLTHHSVTTHCAVSGLKYHWAVKKYGHHDWVHQTSTSNHYDWHNLHSNSKYYYKVKVECSNGYWTDWSSEGWFTTHKSSYGTYCGTPNSSQYSAHQETWNLFRIYCHAPYWKWTCAVKPAGAYDWSLHSTTVNNMGWGNLQPHTKYLYKVQVTCQDGSTSNWSAIKEFWTGGSSGRPNNSSITIVDIPDAEILEVKEGADMDLSLFPSPAREFFTIQGAMAGSQISIVDMQGRTLQTDYVVSQSDQIDITTLKNGMYNVLIRSENGIIETKKLVVVK